MLDVCTIEDVVIRGTWELLEWHNFLNLQFDLSDDLYRQNRMRDSMQV